MESLKLLLLVTLI
jgi:hypothetical protein